MNDPLSRRMWRFKVTNFDDEELPVSCDGRKMSKEEADVFIGTDAEALIEGERRCDLWEDKYTTLAARVTRESLGLVK